MATKAMMPVEEYLRTSFDGHDREYVDGEVVERSMGNKTHSKVQRRLIVRFDALSRKHPLHVFPDMRGRVSAERFRIPDIAVYFGEEPSEEVPSAPPDVAVEILSPDDRMSTMLAKFEEYREWGVTYIWMVDPETRKLATYTSEGIHEVKELPEYEAVFTPDDIFQG
jgi:Uma2 family endonuclease